MEGYQNLHEKLDIKILILFILRRLPDAVSKEDLSELALRDGNVGYFEYADCLAELVDSGHVEQNGNFYKITECGAHNCEVVESSLPYTIRTSLEKHIAPVAEEMRRRAMIKTSYETDETGCRAYLSLSDGLGKIFDLQILCGGEEQAKAIKENFRQNAELLYTKIMELLLKK